jgi:transglutaminase-like putative cysteine protease
MYKILALFGLFVLAAPAAAQAPYLPPCTVLYDDITYTVHWDASYTYEENIAVRLNTAAAVRDDGESFIYYTGPKDTVKVIAAYTTTAAGQRIDVLPDKMLDQQGNAGDDGASYSDTARRTLIFPALAPGAVKTYHYIIASTPARLAGQFFSVENFLVADELKESSVTIYAPVSTKLYFQPVGMQGGPQPDAKPGQQKFFFSLKNVPAQPEEQDSVNWADFSPRLEMTTFAAYADAGAAYEKGAAQQESVTPKVQKLAESIVRGLTSKHAQAVALYDWVSRNIRYVSVTIGDSGFVPNAADDIIDAGYGDCKDHVTLLKALLAAENIPSSGVLVNWGDEFFVPSVASPSFNHIITYIPQFNVYVDSTAEFAPFGVLPALERGKQALITGAAGIPSRLVTLPITTQVPDTARSITQETLNLDGSITGTAVATDTGRYELDDREDFADMQPGTSTQTAAALMQRIGEQGTGDVDSTDPYDLSKPFTHTSNFVLPGYAALAGKATMPIPPGVADEHSVADYPYYLALPARTEPTPCLPKDVEDVSVLHLPAGITITALPANVIFTNQAGSFSSTYTQQGSTVKRQQHLVLTINRATCSPADYAARRAIGFAIGRDERATLGFEGVAPKAGGLRPISANLGASRLGSICDSSLGWTIR